MLEALAFGHFAQIVLNLLPQRLKLLDVAGLGELGQRFDVNDADLRRFAGFFELFKKPVDGLELLLDRQGLGNGHGLGARELVLGGELVDLVLLTEPLYEMEQSAGKSRLLIAYAVPQSFEVANLLLSHFAFAPISQVGRRLHLSGQIVVRPPGCVLHAISLVGGKDLALALQEHGDQGIDARAEALDLTGIEVDGPGQFLLGEAAHASVHEQVLER